MTTSSISETVTDDRQWIDRILEGITHDIGIRVQTKYGSDLWFIRGPHGRIEKYERDYLLGDTGKEGWGRSPYIRLKHVQQRLAEIQDLRGRGDGWNVISREKIGDYTPVPILGDPTGICTACGEKLLEARYEFHMADVHHLEANSVAQFFRRTDGEQTAVESFGNS